MSEEELLRFQAQANEEYVRTTGHDDTCRQCREARLVAQVAREMLEQGDVGEGALRRWAEECSRRVRLLPSMN